MRRETVSTYAAMRRHSGHMEIGTARLEYLWLGPPPEAAPTLVLLHEGLGCVAMWRDFPERLAAATGCGVLVYSRPGYGTSDAAPPPWPLTYMHEHADHALGAVLDHWGIDKAVLVGHSDGASIAAIYAGATRDPRLLALVLLAPHFFVEEISVRSIAEAAEAFGTTDLRARLQRYHGDNVDCAFWGWNRAWLDPGFRTWNIEEYLPKIEVPVLVIQGEDDEYGTRRQVEAAERLAGARVAMLADCGHAPFRDRPDATLTQAADFIAQMAGVQDPARR
jgi:pimeloyl-ACP methyl ester carboxylesterase